MKHVYWFAFYNLNSPTVRYRGKYTTDYLQKHFKVTADIILPAHNVKTAFRFLRIYFNALFFPKKDSLIVIQSVYRKSFYPSLLKILMRFRRRICFYDMDDADYLRYPPENIYWFIKNAKVVTLGSTELVKNLTKYNGNCSLITCPVPDLGLVKTQRNEVFTVGWIGDFQHTHKQSLTQYFFPALHALPFNVKLVLMGVVKPEEIDFLQKYFEEYPHIELEIPQQIDWNNEHAIQHRICEFDVGIATLLDDEFSRSKSAFKLKQCFNNGVPVLSTNLPENNLFLKHGVNGYFCDTSNEFRQRLIEFKTMADDDYKIFSENARAAVPSFDLHHFCTELNKVYLEAVSPTHDFSRGQPA